MKKKGLLDTRVSTQTILHIIMIALTLIFLLPVVLVYIISFSSEQSLQQKGYSFFPTEWSLKSYTFYFDMGMGKQILDSYILTTSVAIIGTILGITITTMFAYALSRQNFKLRRPLSFFIFFTMLFSGGLVPSYIVNTKYLHLDNTIFILIVSGLFSAYNTIILRTFISTTIPDSLIESAKIDGARELTIFARIVVPLSKPGISTIGLFTLIGYWNDWFTGLMYITEPKLVSLQYLLMKIMNNIQFIKDNSRLAYTEQGMELLKQFPTEAGRMALTVIIMTPMLFAYPFFQKYFVKGLTIGSIKG